jgi:hypothetical protein
LPIGLRSRVDNGLFFQIRKGFDPAASLLDLRGHLGALGNGDLKHGIDGAPGSIRRAQPIGKVVRIDRANEISVFLADDLHRLLQTNGKRRHQMRLSCSAKNENM